MAASGGLPICGTIALLGAGHHCINNPLLGNTTYTVTVTNAGGCTDTESVGVTVSNCGCNNPAITQV
ncbi:MAG: hypothetical protein IPN94_25605 [Sphingobacteriales bacterium]|nr:hypothetical protein [Sphingobacteriales bacterium]